MAQSSVLEKYWSTAGVHLQYWSAGPRILFQYIVGHFHLYTVFGDPPNTVLIYCWHFPTVSSTVFEGQLNLEQNWSRRAVIPEQDRLSTGVVPQAY